MLARRVLSWLLAAVLVYLVVVLAYWLGQERLTYFPGPRPGPLPRVPALEIREEWIETQDGERLHAWFVQPRTSAAGAPPKGAVLVCHGNAGNLEMRLPLAAGFASMGFATLLFDYRGYGASTGKPRELGTYLDAEAACDRLAGGLGFGLERIAAYGESLGGAVAIELALRRRIAAVLVEDTFTSMADMGSRLYPWLPVRLLLRARYDSKSKVPRLAVHLLVIHSPEDDLVPFEFGRELFEAANEPKSFLETGGSHDDLGFLGKDEWIARVRSFLESAF